MKYQNIREEELKNKVGSDWFSDFDSTEILGNIDFTVFPKHDGLWGKTALLWAEAKTGDYDIPTMFVQLILTIGKARTFDKTLPPVFLAAFDYKKIAFVPYKNIQDIFYLNDFNWNITPSNTESKEFRLVKQRIEEIINKTSFVFDYEEDKERLEFFIQNNIGNSDEGSKIKIDKNNFVPIYLRWLDVIKPIIGVNWDELKTANILDSDFYLADLFVDDKDTAEIEHHETIRDNLFVVFKNQGYYIAKENINQMFDATISIKNTDIYRQFWKLYKRPPIDLFHEYIIQRRDLLVPQDIRERKGAFFTPRKWVELSQKYIADYLGENWQEEYYIWDCAAGTGNLLIGLTNKYNIWASTLDQADVNAMNERISNGANLLKSHVFQFDFLNDDFSKLPEGLQKIINDENKRKKLIIYINPPYAEATTARTVVGTGENKPKTATDNKTYLKYRSKISKASNELFAQFLTRIYFEIPSCKIANFSTIKNLQSYNFRDFRSQFQAKLEKLFLVPAATFDNVTGDFPIGFFIWNTTTKEQFAQIDADVYSKNAELLPAKKIVANDDVKTINQWITEFNDAENNVIGLTVSAAPDFQHNGQLTILSKQQKRYCFNITANNIYQMCVYFAVRHCIGSTWLNDRDQFLYPNDNWQTDKEFQTDCLAFTLFHGQNRITSAEAVNHWIPFSEAEVDAQDTLDSHFMTDFIKGKLKNHINTAEKPKKLFEDEKSANSIVEKNSNGKKRFSEEAKAVFNSGRELWQYYHKQSGANPNASLYDIRVHFQGRNAKGRMNNTSKDENYTKLLTKLRDDLKILAKKIEPKVYEYGFLKN